MSCARETVAPGLLVVLSLTLCACDSLSGSRTKQGFLPVQLDSLEGLELEGLETPGAGAAPPATARVSGSTSGGARPTSRQARSRAASQPTVRGLTFRDEPLDEAFRTLSTVTDAPILVTPAARQVIEDEDLTLDLDLTVSLPLSRVLDLMTGLSPELDHEFRSGVWQVARRDEVLGGRRVSKIFDVRDLVAPRTQFLPPRISGIPTGEFDEFGRGGGEAEEKTRALEPDELLMLVQDSLGPENFAPEGPVTLEYLDSGYLMLSGPERAVRRLSGRL